MMYEYMKDSTIGEKIDIDTFVMKEGNRTQADLWTVYERYSV